MKESCSEELVWKRKHAGTDPPCKEWERPVFKCINQSAKPHKILIIAAGWSGPEDFWRDAKVGNPSEGLGPAPRHNTVVLRPYKGVQGQVIEPWPGH